MVLVLSCICSETDRQTPVGNLRLWAVGLSVAQALEVGVAALITEPPMVLGWLGGCCARLCACALVVVLLSVLGRIARE